MTRPTKAEVDVALEGAFTPGKRTDILAAEVVALREEVDVLEFENREMRRHGRNGPMVVLEGKYNAALLMIHKLRRQQKLEGVS